MRSRALMTLGLVPVVLSSWLVGAHFLRFFALELVAFFVFLPLVLLARRSWAVRVMQVALLLGTFIWVRTAWSLASDRAALGEPWGRLVLILGTVAAVTLLSVFVLETGPFRRRYGLRTGDMWRAAPPAPDTRSPTGYLGGTVPAENEHPPSGEIVVDDAPEREGPSR